MKSKSKSHLVKPLLSILILSGLSGCGLNTTGPVHLNNYCALTKPIFYDSVEDSPATVAEIEAHNLRYECLCNNDCPKD